MIEGMTILNSTPIEEPSLVLMIVIPIVVMLGVLTACLILDVDDTLSIFFSIVAAVFMVITVFNSTLEPTGRYRYECLLSEDVSLVEVYERYEIVEQRGEIFILEDKESEG